MRPLQLNLQGFASFRKPTTVDFSDADFFALVGPTGSGKSTVVDAITFALYGSAPRWNNRHAVQYALAPTVNRGTVRLVFDAGAHRYTVAREVRRTTQGVSQRAVSLERYADPNATGDQYADEPTEPLADNITGTTRVIEQLLGLTFEDFCQCVVLPQGQFADFLRATAKQRQDILLKLLGARQYDLIRAAASERSMEARERATVYEAQRAKLADATPEAVEAEAQRLSELTDLGATAEASETVIASLQRSHAEAASERESCEQELTILQGITVPPEAAERQRQVAEARRSHEAARAAETECRRVHDRARTAVAAVGDPHELRGFDADWRELTEVRSVLPAAEQRYIGAEAALSVAVEAAEAADQQAEQARTARDEAARLVEAADQRLAELTSQFDAVRSVGIPPEVSSLSDRVIEATEQLRLAEERQDAADTRADQARQRAERHDLDALRPLLAAAQERDLARTTLIGQEQQLVGAEKERQASRDAEAAAVAGERDARRHLDETAALAVATRLRAGLTAGDSCPVCDQIVLDPPAVPADAHAAQVAAEQALAEAEERTAAARARVAEAEQERTVIAVAADATRSRLRTLAEQLAEAGDPELDALNADLSRAETAAADLRSADQAAREASQASRSARQARDALNNEVAAGRRLLEETQRPLVPLGVPVLDSDLATAWAQLADWASRTADSLKTTSLPAAETAAQECRSVLKKKESDWQATDAAARAAAKAHRVAQATVAKTQTIRNQLTDRQAVLTTKLHDAPTADAVSVALHTLRKAEAAEKDAYNGLTQAREKAESAGKAVELAEAVLNTSRAELARSRDLVIHLGAPDLTGTDLVSDWEVLAPWADGESVRRVARLPLLVEAETTAQSAVVTAINKLRRQLESAGLNVAETATVQQLRLQLAQAISTAEAERAQAQRNLRELRQADQDLATAREQHEVASTLASQLQANRFQRWLAGAALETLVQGASESLLELSAGQFDLTHHHGEFFIIDHADAEAERSVRTLSGGETFQTSLALALALSEQLSSLTSGGVQLDSIFLDEGFGTLDDASLDVVATTLERLAQGERMVGIITHVRELADRVPLRYQVRRDSAGSHVIRESL